MGTEKTITVADAESGNDRRGTKSITSGLNKQYSKAERGRKNAAVQKPRRPANHTTSMRI